MLGYIVCPSLCFVLLLVIFVCIQKVIKNKHPEKWKTLVVLGSGGHTTEMLKLISALDKTKFFPRIYVSASSDVLSQEKVKSQDKECQIITIPRPRKVAQSWISSIPTTLYSFVCSYKIMYNISPDLLICNGPGTCLPMCLAAWINTRLAIAKTKVIFVESYCRVKTLSLTGRILYYIADEFVVQWPDLTQKYPHVTYIENLL